MKESNMAELISLNGDKNTVKFIRGNDGDICITFNIPQKQIFWECVRVGNINAGGQTVPVYVKKALNELVDAMEQWDKEA